MSKQKLGRDPLKDEGLSFIRDTRKGRKSGSIGTSKSIGNTETPQGSKMGRPIGSGSKDRMIWKRTSFIMQREQVEKLRALAWQERTTATDLLSRALEAFFKGKTIKMRG